MGDSRLMGFAAVDEAGVTCCCRCDSEDNIPSCRWVKNCYEAVLDVQVLMGTRPSDKATEPLRQANRAVKQATKDTRRGVQKIKEGVASLEKAVKGSRFRI